MREKFWEIWLVDLANWKIKKHWLFTENQNPRLLYGVMRSCSVFNKEFNIWSSLRLESIELKKKWVSEWRKWKFLYVHTVVRSSLILLEIIWCSRSCCHLNESRLLVYVDPLCNYNFQRSIIRVLTFSTTFLLVCPQTFSHTVMCKIFLTVSNIVFGADALVRQNHWILPKTWRVIFFECSPH